MKQHYLNSSFREKLIEHLFVGELLKLSWKQEDYSLEIACSEVDNQGYDIIAEANGVIRHIQLKAAYIGSRTANQKIHVALSTKPSGCVVWVFFNEKSMQLGPFLFFGGVAGEPLSEISGLKVAKHTKGNAQGEKKERSNIRVINKGQFVKYDTIQDLYDMLFNST